MVDVERLKEAGIVSIRDYLLELQAEGKQVARTESGDPSFDIPIVAHQAILEALEKNLTHYTPGAGIPMLREAIFEKLTRENKIFLDSPQDILVTNGAMNALYVVFQAIAQEMMDMDKMASVLVPSPTWTETVDNIELANMKPVYYKLDPFADPCIDIEAITRIVENDSSLVAIVVNTPHNPTGAVVDRRTLAELAELASRHLLFLVTDEAYEHVIYNPYEHVSVASCIPYEGIVSIFSCSKSYAMSGLRIGYAATRCVPLFKKMSKMVRCTINGVNSISQYGAAAALLDTPQSYFDEQKTQYTNRRNALFNAVSKCSFLDPVLPKGAFYVWAKIKEGWEGFNGDTSGWGATAMLLEKGVGSAPGEVFGPLGKNHIRFSFSCANNYIEMASKVLELL